MAELGDNMGVTIEDIRHRATLSVPEAAALLGMGRGSAYEAVRNGDLPALRLGRRLLVPVPALLRLLDDGSMGTPTDGDH